MTKLEEKLKELKYYDVGKYYGIRQYRKIKKYKNRHFNINFDIEYINSKAHIKRNFIFVGVILNKEELTGLRKAFNVMQKDLEVLRNVED